jgi:hypothetical protein
MTEVLVAIVGGLALVVNGLVANRGRQHAKAARKQVENSHSTNLREEGDERHEENKQLLHDVLERVAGVKSDIRGLRKDVGRLYDADRTHEERIHELERTKPPRGKKE